MPRPARTLSRTLARLRKAFGRPMWPPTADAFELVLLENVAYLATPERRLEAFRDLKKKIGTRPAALAQASRTALEKIGTRGILAEGSAEKLSECARIALEEFDGDLDAALGGSAAAAKKALRHFPGIGEPGAE